MRHLRRLAASLGLALGLLSACGGEAMAGPTLYVDRDSVGGQCSDSLTLEQVDVDSPWCSLERASGAAPGGSTVLVRRGSYPGLEVRDEARAEYVGFEAYEGEAPSIDGIEVCNSTRFRFEGFRITDNNLIYCGSQHVQFVANDITDGTKALHDVEDILFEGNYVHDVALHVANPTVSVGFWAGGSPAPRGIVLRRNRFERLPNDGAFLSGYDLLVERNEFIEIQSPDNDIAHADVVQCMGCHGFTFRRNYARDNDSGLLNSTAGSDGWLVENNVFVRSEIWSFQIDNRVDDLILRNNTFWGSALGVLLRWSDDRPRNPSGYVIANNVTEKLSVDSRLNVAFEDYNLIAGGQNTPSPNAILANPVFVDEAAGDLRLAAGSPGIDAGTAEHAASVDILGGARPVDDPEAPNTGGGSPDYHDMGAHERLSSPSEEEPPPPEEDPPPPEEEDPPPEEEEPPPEEEDPPGDGDRSRPGRAPESPGRGDSRSRPREDRDRGSHRLGGAGAGGPIRIGVPRRQRLRSGRVVAYVRCARRCRIGARARIGARRRAAARGRARVRRLARRPTRRGRRPRRQAAMRGRRISSRHVVRRVGPGRRARLVLRFRRGGRLALRRALRRQGALHGIVRVTVRDGAGRRSSRRRVRVRG